MRRGQHYDALILETTQPARRVRANIATAFGARIDSTVARGTSMRSTR